MGHLRIVSGVCCIGLAFAIAGCSAPPVGTDNANSSNNNDNASNDNNDNRDGGVAGLPFASINGTEVLMEGTLDDRSDGGFARRDERLTAEYVLRPTDAVVSQAFIGDDLVDVISGGLTGTAELIYAETASSFEPGLDCPEGRTDGNVSWTASVTGAYEYIPALGTITVTALATDVSSPEYTVFYTSPGCPADNSQSASATIWQGPGQGTWGFVTIVLQDGVFDARVENPVADDRGAADFFDIHVDTTPAPQ